MADLCVTPWHARAGDARVGMSAAAQAARDREKSLQPLLSRHRLLAIAKAPARTRLEVARRLATEDPQNPGWPEEVASLESARLEEVEAETQAAMRDRNDASIEAL